MAPTKTKTTASTPSTRQEASIAGKSTALLQALHILTRDGRLNQDSHRKLKQVDHLLQFIAPLLLGKGGDSAASAPRASTTVVDHGAGKSYLGFLLYDHLFKTGQVQGQIIGVESRADLVQRSQALATSFGFEHMRFLAHSVTESTTASAMPERVTMVTALHACDTATDDAIAFALHKQAQHVVLVPCCQAELASALRGSKALSLRRTPLAELWRHPLHTRELGSQVSNVLRCLQLEAHGYSVSVTELVGWEHSMKNELIIASRHPDVAARSAARRIGEILDTLGVPELRTRYFVPPESAEATAISAKAPIEF
jgi:Methyltransferase domain